MSEEKKIINDEALENVDGGFVVPRPKPTDLADGANPSKWVKICQDASDDGAII